ncbi:basic proline-rich protein-like [Sorex araneus]|uniref:basic proline-rich protein-like n=1 Tax=Sorex araneus TaxID=42254 RepID=UPI002433DB7D|nr:basic proline-rich protein-like [Sorex araneus]
MRTRMEHCEMQPHGAPEPGASFSHSHLPGPPARPSTSPLVPVLRKTIHLEAFSPNHIPPAPSRPGLGARSERGGSLGARKFSSVSLTLHPSRPWALSPHLGREAAPQGGRRATLLGWTPETLPQGGRGHPGSPRSSWLPTPSRNATADRPVVSSCLSLPFRAHLGWTPAGPGGSGPGGQGPPPLPVPLEPARASPGRGQLGARALPRPRLLLQRGPPGGPAVGPGTNTALDTARPGVARSSAARATNRLNRAVSPATPSACRGDPGTEAPTPETKGDSTMDLPTVGSAKPDVAMGPVAPAPDQLGRAGAPGDTRAGSSYLGRAAPGPGPPGTARATLALSRPGRAPGWVVPVTPDPATGESPQGTGPAPGHTAASPQRPGTNPAPAPGPASAEPAEDSDPDRSRETAGKGR